MARVRTITVVAAISAAALAGCGNELNTDRLEKAIIVALPDRQDQENAKADCPAKVEAKAGASFDCTLTRYGDFETVTVTLQNDQGSRFDYTAESLSGSVVSGNNMTVD